MGKRNLTLDLVKCIASFLIVFIHAPFEGLAGQLVSTIAQGGVLFFFMVSGYFSFGADEAKIKYSIKHTLQLIAYAYVINLLRILISTDFHPGAQLAALFTVKHILQFLILNISNISGVLWFLLALLYCYLIYDILVVRLQKLTLFYWMSFSCLVINFLIGDIFCHLGIIRFSGYVRNFLITGVPFFGLGNWIHSRKTVLCKAKWLSVKYLVSLMLLGTVVAVLECIRLDGMITYTIGSLIMVISLFIFAICKPDIRCSLLNEIGKQCGFYIYILHPVMIHVLRYFLGMQINQNLFAVLVLICTVCCSMLIELLKGHSFF